MKYIRIFGLLLGWLIAIPATGQFNPTNPPEPGQPQPKYQLNLKADPANGASVSGSGTYEFGQKVSVTASAASGFIFLRWEDEEGNTVSTNRSFSYVMPRNNSTLTARMRYNPSNPTEPDQPKVDYANVTLQAYPQGGGSVSGAGRYLVGTNVTVSATSASGFQFNNWTQGDEVISTQRSFKYEVKEGENSLTANFTYSPSNPGEPDVPATTRRLYLNSLPSGGGYFNISSRSRYEPGKKVRLTATPNSGFVFSEWTDEEGNTISTQKTFDFTMPAVDASLTAVFVYSPTNPGEPSDFQPRRNVIYGQKQSTLPGGSVMFDINLENMDAIEGIAIDIKMPENLTPDYSAIITTDRSKFHTVTAENVENGFTRILVRGQQPLEGSNGAVVRFPVRASADVEAGTILSVDLAKGVVYKTDGSQTPVDAIDGIVRIADETINMPDSPDFVVEEISAERGNYLPGENISVAWKVVNRGTTEASGGWSETVSLVDAAGNRSPIATLYYDTTSLQPGESIARNADIALPGIPGISGELDLSVTVIPFTSSGEIEDMQLNNTAKTDDRPITLGKLLIAEMPAMLDENDTSPKRCRLVRTGLWNVAESFSLTLVKGDQRLIFPDVVTIPRYQSAAYFNVSVEDNSILDESDSFTLEIKGNGYPESYVEITITDNEHATVDLTTSKDSILEGESDILTIELPRVATEDITVRLTAEYPGRLSLPESVVIPAGESMASVEVKAIDNKAIDGDKDVAIRAAIDGQLSGETYLLVMDNDIPHLSLEILPKDISEAGGIYAARAVLSRSDNLDSKVTIRLSDDSKGELLLPYRELVMNSGVESIEFTVGTTDNTEVDGNRKVTLTAAVYISSCNCTSQGSGVGSVSETLTIIDDDGPSLTLTASNPTLKEGNNAGIWLTVSRNTDVSQPVEATIATDNGEGLIFDSKVVIPIGDKSARVKVTAPHNLTTGDGKTIVFSASAPDYSTGTCWVMVTDNTLPDANITGISVEPMQAMAGATAGVDITLANYGDLDLPEMLPVTVYADGKVAKKLYLQQPLTPGEELTLSTEITLPSKVGFCEVYAVANEEKTVKETLFTNNRSATTRVTLTSPYSLTVKTAKPLYKQGENVAITGNVTSGKVSGEVEIFIINGGVRQTISVSPDDNGEFSAIFTPYQGQGGVFRLGACYPGAGEREGITSFEIPALRRTSSKALTLEAVTGTPSSINVEIANVSSTPLKNVELTLAEILEGWDIETETPAEIAPGATGRFTITATPTAATEGRDWIRSPFTVTAENGAEVSSILYLYAFDPKGALGTDISHIVTNITAGKETLYPITVTNKGKGDTGTITVNLPEWMSSVTPTTLPSLSVGESTQIMLRLTVTDRMNLNHPVTGQLGLNCANGRGVTIGYAVTPVSDEKSALLVEAADEYTYNTSEGPLVKGAAVSLTHPATGKTVFNGVTDEEGICGVEIEAGYYRLTVSAERHETYSDFVFVSPGETKVVRADIGYNPITFNWNVVETEVEDEYEIETIVTYETNVPMPVVKIDIPKRIDGDNMMVGDAVLINMTLTNIGLIKALNVTPVIPHDLTEWEFEILDNAGPFDLNAQQSKVVPIKITRIADLSASGAPRRNAGETMTKTFRDCMAAVGDSYEVMCGKKLRTVESAENLALKYCATSATVAMVGNVIGNVFSGSPTLPGSPGGSGGGGGTGGSGSSVSSYGEPTGSTSSFSLCNECDAKKAEQLIDTLLGFTWLKSYNDMLNEAIKRYREQGREIVVRQRPIWQRVRDKAREVADKVLPGDFGDLAGLAFDIYEVTRPCDQYMNDHPDAPAKAPVHSWITNFENESKIMTDQLTVADRFMLANLGDRVWSTELDKEKADFIDYVLSLPEGTILSDEEIMEVKPSSVSLTQAKAAVENMMGRELPEISDEEYEAIATEFESIEKSAVEKGFEGYADLYMAEYDAYKRHFDDLRNNSVCASITLKISQQMTLTRQAFRGYLTVYNGHDSRPIQDLRLNLVVRDDDGNVATAHEFQINPESLDGFTGELNLTSGWELAAGGTGNATVLFIPTRFAAPDEEKVYSFGGSISYLDPYNDMVVTRSLCPVELTVRPTPELELTYFMQRDVFGDDPLTPNVIEPSIPAEFALVINNVGAGVAEDVKMTTSQPEIVDNEKGLAIDMEFLSSQLNGSEHVLALGGATSSEFGDIPPHTTAYAQWWLQSNLLGHFVDYDVTVNHLTSYGNPDLSLITDVRILELIHGFTPEPISETGGGRCFLVNEVDDSEDVPDHVYFSDSAVRTEVTPGNGSIVNIDDNEYELTVTGEKGWIYGSVEDLTLGRRRLSRIVRMSDGAELPTDNFWQTAVTLRDGKNPQHETMLHFICRTEGSETYRLVFDPRPLNVLKVESFSGAPEKNELVKEQVSDIIVRFNKPIDPSTFDKEDIELHFEGEKVHIDNLTVTNIDGSTFLIDLSAYTGRDGYYVLTVMTEGLTDMEGFNGESGASTSWIQYIDGMVSLTISAVPAEGGTVTPESGKAEFGVPLAIAATPNEGYLFDGWWIDGMEYSTLTETDYTPLRESVIEARFSPASGVSNLSDSDRFRIWPLPLGEELYIEGPFSRIDRLGIFTPDGLCVREIQDIRTTSAVDIGELQTGLYILKVETDNGTFSVKALSR